MWGLTVAFPAFLRSSKTRRRGDLFGLAPTLRARLARRSTPAIRPRRSPRSPPSGGLRIFDEPRTTLNATAKGGGTRGSCDLPHTRLGRSGSYGPRRRWRFEQIRPGALCSSWTSPSPNPLFSSLRFADGPFTVYDLERLGQVPHLVVLAACDSGRSAVRPGDELLGHGVAFLTHGTSNSSRPSHKYPTPKPLPS